MEPRKLSCDEKVGLVGGRSSIQTAGNVAGQPEGTWTCDHQDRHCTRKVPAIGPVNLLWMYCDFFKPILDSFNVIVVFIFPFQKFPQLDVLNKTLLEHVTWIWIWISLSSGRNQRGLDETLSLLFGSSLLGICPSQPTCEPEQVLVDILTTSMNSVSLKQLPDMFRNLM